MGLIVKDPGGGDGNFEPIPEDLYPSVCYAVYDLGTQYNETWETYAHKVLLGFEIPSERIMIDRDGEQVNLPRAISERYTLSLHEKAKLRQVLEGWRGRAFTDDELAGFDLKNILGKTCQIQTVHVTTKKGRKVANIQAIVKAPKGVKLEPENDLQWFSMEESLDIPPYTPDWIREIIMESKEWKQACSPEPQKDDNAIDPDSVPTFEEGSDIPF